MAQYKYGHHLNHSTHEAYDATHKPDITSPDPGIYRCTGCGDEIGIAKGHTLPPQNHHQHTSNAPILWQLLVFAQHNS